MKLAVVGAGSIGGYLGARLALAGEEVTFVARGANLEAIRRHGFKLIEEDGSERIAETVKAASIEECGAQDTDSARREGPSGHGARQATAPPLWAQN